MTCCYFIRCIYVHHNIANLHESTGLCCKQTFLAGSIWQKRYTRLLGIIIITTMPNIQHRLHLWKRTTCSPLFYSIKQQTGFVLLLIYSLQARCNVPWEPRRDPSRVIVEAVNIGYMGIESTTSSIPSNDPISSLLSILDFHIPTTNFQITGRFPISTISLNSLNVSFWLGFNLTSSTRLITTHSSPLIGLVTLLKLLYSPYLTKLGCRPTEGNPHFSCHWISALPLTPLITQFY